MFQSEKTLTYIFAAIGGEWNANTVKKVKSHLQEGEALNVRVATIYSFCPS